SRVFCRGHTLFSRLLFNNDFALSKVQSMPKSGMYFSLRRCLFTACLAAAGSMPAWSQGAFPTTTGQMYHTMPTDAADARPAVQDHDNVEVRDRTPEDDARLEREAAEREGNNQVPPGVSAPPRPVTVPDAPIVSGVEIVG